MFKFLLVLQAIVTLGLIVVILMQRSEGGGLGMGGGSPSGLMSARGAADFLTRATTVLATLFIALSIILAGLASSNRTGGDLDTSLVKTKQSAPALPATTPTPGTSIPLEGGAATKSNDPLAGAAAQLEADKKGDEPASKQSEPKQPAQGGIPIKQ